jgi:hypothetical protein
VKLFSGCLHREEREENYQWVVGTWCVLCTSYAILNSCSLTIESESHNWPLLSKSDRGSERTNVLPLSLMFGSWVQAIFLQNHCITQSPHTESAPPPFHSGLPQPTLLWAWGARYGGCASHLWSASKSPFQALLQLGYEPGLDFASLEQRIHLTCFSTRSCRRDKMLLSICHKYDV